MTKKMSSKYFPFEPSFDCIFFDRYNYFIHIYFYFQINR